MAQIVAIQELRAVAALAVVFGHAQSEAAKIAEQSGGHFGSILLDITGAGVDLFFVISGFVMVHASSRLFATPGGPGVFMARRVARIAPLYWCATALYLAVMFGSPGMLSNDAPTLAEIARSFLFIPYWHPGDTLMQPVYRLGWTLNYEMFFYAVFALCLLVPMKRAVAALALAFGALVIVGLAFAPAHGVFAFWSNPIVLEFVAGAVLALAWSAGVRLPRSVSALLILTAGAWLLRVHTVGVEEGTLLRPLLLGIPAAMIFAACVLREAGQARPGFLAAVGDASYALYLAHPIVIRVARRLWDVLARADAPDPWIFVAVCVFVSLAVSFAVYRLFEMPITRRIQAILLPARASASAQSVSVG